MPDQINSLQQLNILFQNLIIDMLGFEKTGSPAAYSETAFKAVRVSWPTDGAPAWLITDDVCFIRIAEEDDPYNKLRESKYEDILGNIQDVASETWYTRIIGLHLVLYGPSSFTNAMNIRDLMFKFQARRTLSESNLYIIPSISSPNRLPELFQGRWWERVDMKFKFNELVIREEDIPAILSAQVEIITDQGATKTISVS